MSFSRIPAGYHTVTPYIVVRGAAQAIEFYERAFNAREVLRLPAPNGLLAHAEIEIGDSRVMLADENEELDCPGPQTIGGTASSILLYVNDVDALFQQAIEAGAKSLRPVQDQFYGDRSGFLEDPFGHRWSLATHIEDVSQEEAIRRFHALAAPPAE
ncbi:MAG: VOC family protein [Planctomycetaceae bacterium]